MRGPRDVQHAGWHRADHASEVPHSQGLNHPIQWEVERATRTGKGIQVYARPGLEIRRGLAFDKLKFKIRVPAYIFIANVFRLIKPAIWSLVRENFRSSL